MPSYTEHRSNAIPLAGFVALGVFAISVYYNYSIVSSVSYSAICFTLVLFGAALPDIDHHASIPRRKAGSFILLLMLISYIIGVDIFSTYLGAYFDSELTRKAALGILSVTGLYVLPSLISLFGDLFDQFTKHRGLTHTFITGLTISIIIMFGLEMAMSQGIFNINSYLPKNITNIEFSKDSKLPLIVGIAIYTGYVKHIYDDKKS